jgi:hypothetical protein
MRLSFTKNGRRAPISVLLEMWSKQDSNLPASQIRPKQASYHWRFRRKQASGG